MQFWRACLGAGLVFLSACVSGSEFPSRRESLARQIADDAAAFNDAYGQAVSAQILLNILRSRDRLPRYYLAMTGIADSPSWRYRQNAGIGAIPLGDINSPWGLGAAALERETQSRPTYAVQPFDAETLTRTAFLPTSPDVFAHYWRSGWPRDLLLLMMVESIEKTDGDGNLAIYTNEANTIFNNCPDRIETEGCAFVRQVRELMMTVNDPPPDNGIDREYGRPLCGMIEAYAPTTPIRPVAPREGVDCDPAIVVGQITFRLRLRSLDDMIYYVGELLRAGSMNATDGESIEAQVTVGAAGLRGGGAGVPLFRITPADAAHANVYAAQVSYGGQRYVAGPANGRSCGEAAERGPCRDNAEEGDRSSSVLSLIAEILALNQSSDAILAPNRLLAE
jgi:hypothetical protein